jgi:hypothetical protein
VLASVLGGLILFGVLSAIPALEWLQPYLLTTGWTAGVDALRDPMPYDGMVDAKLPSFPAAITVVDRVAEIAEERDHHPDIDIRWRTLTFRCSTHSAGGITEADIKLAGSISEQLDAAG